MKICHLLDNLSTSMLYVAQNPLYWSNEEENLRLIHQVINVYISTKLAELKLPETHAYNFHWDCAVYSVRLDGSHLSKCNTELVPCILHLLINAY